MGGRIITGSINCSDIIVNKDLITEYSNSNTAIAEGTKELEVSVNRREYNIVGDELYIPKRYEDAPQWLRDIIDTVTSAALSGALNDVSTLGDMLTGLIAELNVAKNTYTMSVISDNDINERINTAITTLNSSLADADSTILDVAMTRVTPEEAQTIALGILSASIAGGDISAAVQNLQSAIADVDSARALDYTRLNASIGDEFESTATAISTINAYVGIDEAGASTGTGLSAYLEDSNGVIGGVDSQLNNTIKVTAEGIESKFEYNSIVNINGVYKKSGFGLTTNYTSGNGTQANPYVSEFWIDASRLKFTNSNVTGQATPFTIDASGTTPQITFNGKVAFGNVNGANMSGSNLLYNSAPAIGFETKGWQADYNSTGIASSGVIAAGDPYRPTGAGAFNQYIPGTPAAGTVFDIRAIGAIPVIGGQFYEGSAYLNSHRCYSQIYVGWRDSAGTTITWSMGDIVIQTNTTNVLATWGRSKFIVQAPANAVSCYYYIRGTSTGEENPYVFVSMCYFGRASEGQSVFSSWSEGISASLSSSDVSAIANSAVNNISWQSEVQAAINNNATTIDGGKITTGTVNTNRLNVNDIMSKNMTFTGKITGGSGGLGGIIQSYNGKMKIDLVNGSIYIA